MQTLHQDNQLQNHLASFERNVTELKEMLADPAQRKAFVDLFLKAALTEGETEGVPTDFKRAAREVKNTFGYNVFLNSPYGRWYYGAGTITTFLISIVGIPTGSVFILRTAGPMALAQYTAGLENLCIGLMAIALGLTSLHINTKISGNGTISGDGCPRDAFLHVNKDIIDTGFHNMVSSLFGPNFDFSFLLNKSQQGESALERLARQLSSGTPAKNALLDRVQEELGSQRQQHIKSTLALCLGSHIKDIPKLLGVERQLRNQATQTNPSGPTG